MAPTNSLLMPTVPLFAFLEDDEAAPAAGVYVTTPAFATAAGASQPSPLSPTAE